jgi:hypothetical protein
MVKSLRRRAGVKVATELRTAGIPVGPALRRSARVAGRHSVEIIGGTAGVTNADGSREWEICRHLADANLSVMPEADPTADVE